MTRERKPTDWCILRTNAARTLRLAETLNAEGIEAWSPARIVKRPAPGQRRRLHMGQRRVMVEVAVPILPGFVFAREPHLADLVRAIAAPFGPHPPFSILQLGERVPFIGDRQVAGLRQAEADAAAITQAERDADDRERERQARAERLGTEAARRKSLRQERKDFEADARVTVAGVPAFAGMVGTVVEGRGTSALVNFGGSLTMQVEAWQIQTVDVHETPPSPRAAA